MTKMFFSRSAARVFAAVVGLVLWMPAIAFAQRPLELAPPHVLIQGLNEREAVLLSEVRQWPLEDGSHFNGSLCQWYVPDGLVLMQNPAGHPEWRPLRAFAAEAEKEIASLLAPHAERMQQLLAIRPVLGHRSWTLASADLPGGAIPIEVTNSDVTWRAGSAYFRTPVTALNSGDLEEITTALAERDRRTSWETVLPGEEFAAELVGQSETAFVFRDLIHRSVRPVSSNVLVAKSALSGEARAQAAQVLAPLPEGGVIAEEQLPEWWCWLGVSYLEGPGIPIELEGDKLKCEFPPPATLQRSAANMPGVRDWKRISPLGQLELRLLMAERELKASGRGPVGDELSRWRSEKRAEIIAEDPVLYLSPVTQWRLRDQSPQLSQEARLLGERDGDWIFGYGPEKKSPAAVRKEELAESMVAVATQTIRRLDEYFAAHREAERPNLATSFRVVRKTTGAAAPMEPLELDGSSMKVRELRRDGTLHTTEMHSTFLHFLDVRDLKLALAGVQPGSKPEGLDPALLAKVQGWVLEKTDPRAAAIVLSAELLGQHLDSLILRREKVEFLVDRDVLTAESREKADRMLALRREHSEGGQDDSPVVVPELRMWSISGTTFIGPGKDARFNARGDLQFVDAEQRRRMIQTESLPDAVAVEIQTQIEADKELRSGATDGKDAQLLAKLTEFKRTTRARLSERLEILAPRLFEVAGSSSHIRGHFIQFDGDDAIFRGGPELFFRVYPFQLTEKTLREIKQMTAASDTPQCQYPPPKVSAEEVTARWLRGARPNEFLAPATPIALQGKYLHFRLLSGSSLRHEIDLLHPRDAAEIRGDIYRQHRGIERDDEIDERLRQPVPPEEVLTQAVPLTDAWRQQFDALLEPRELTWQTHEPALEPGESLRALSADGTQLLIAGRSLRVADIRGAALQGKHRQPLNIALDPEPPVFLAEDGRSIVGFTDGELTQWDAVTGQVLKRYADDIGPPVSAVQSVDGTHLFLLSPAGRVTVIQPGLRTQTTLEIEATPAVLGQPWKIACSPSGKHFAFIDASHLQIFAADEKTGSYERDLRTEMRIADPVIAMSERTCLLGGSEVPAVMMIEFAAERPQSVTLITGIFAAWIGIDEAKLFPTFQVIGKRGDIPPHVPLGPSLSSYSATFEMDGSRGGTPQTLEHVLTPKSLVASSGRTIAYDSKGRWFVSRRGELSAHRLEPLDAIAKTLVNQQEVGQIEAAWAYLRSEPFHKVGAYPDHASETFLDYLNAHVQRFGWEHGGDLQQRAETLLDRWATIAPNSLVVPVLQAIYWRDMAWQARGTGFADSVAKEGAERFDRRMRTAAGFLKPLLQSEKPPTRVYNLTFEIAMSLGLPLETTKGIARSMMKTPVRVSMPPHQAVVLLLLPRWHGQPGDSEQYIRNVADLLGGDEGDAMYAQLILYAAKFYPKGQPVRNFLELDLERLLDGLQAHFRESPSDALLSQALEIFAQEERWDLYRKAMQLAIERRVLPRFPDIQSWIQHRTHASRAFAAER